MAMSPQLLLHLFFLLCIGSNVTQSAKRNTTNSGDLLSLLNAKPEGIPPVSENLSESKPLGDIQASDYMVRLFLRISKSNGQVINPDAFMGDNIHGFIDNDGSNDSNFTFNVSIPTNEILKSAKLLLYKYPSNNASYSRSSLLVTIHDIYSGREIASKLVAIQTVGWISFELPRGIILRWDRKPQTNAGVSVRIAGSPRLTINAIRFATRQKNATFQPLIVAYCSVTSSLFAELQRSTDKRVPRVRRSDQSSHKGKCGLQNLNINFKDLGWDKWVIAPKQYSASYCAGTCLDRYDNTQSNHALIQLMMHQETPGYANAPCCAPTQLAPISMLYYGGPGESTYVLKQMKDWVVTACGCK